MQSIDTDRDAESSVGEIATIAQSEATWTLFVRSGRVCLVKEVTLRRALEDLERRLTTAKCPEGSQGRRPQGAERIRSYLAEIAQHF